MKYLTLLKNCVRKNSLFMESVKTGAISPMQLHVKTRKVNKELAFSDAPYSMTGTSLTL